MRVLCSTTPMEGVLAPVVPLASALLARGHDVLVATAPGMLGRVRETGLTAVAAGPDAPAAAAAAVQLPEFHGGQEPWRIGAVMFSKVMAPAKFLDLTAIAAEFEPDLIVHAPVDLAAPVLAVSLGLPSITYGTGLVLERPLLAAMTDWVAPLWNSVGLVPEPDAGLYRRGYLDPVPIGLQPDLGSASAVSNPIKPAVPGDPAAHLPDWWQRLGDRPIVYVTLGTVPIFNQPAEFGPLIAGLDGLDIDAVITVGNATDPSSLGSLPSNVHVAQWLSLAAILPHCAAVMCHGGAGTTLAALACGVPMVLSPRGADQHPTAEACAVAGAARVLNHDDVDAQAVHAAITSVLTEDSYGAAARRLRDEIAVMPTADAVALDLAQRFAVAS